MSDLLGYLLKLDEPDERRRVEERLRGDPLSAGELAALQRAIAPLEADRPAPEPPADLVARTIGRVAEHVCAEGPPAGPKEPLIEELMARMSPARLQRVMANLDRGSGGPSRWRRADYIVLASILLVGLGLFLSAMPYLRYRQNLSACQNHLRQLYGALDTYADAHQDRFPQVTEAPPNNTAASFVAMLQEAGALPLDAGPGCPAGPGSYSTYAYTLGYRDESGELRGLRRAPNLANWELLPLAADRPTVGRTSPNPDHRYGQNVLFAGGNVRFCTSGNVGVNGDDIYRNQLNEVRAGLSIFDSVLGVGGDHP